MNKMMPLRLFILLVILDHSCRDVISWLCIICEFTNLLLFIGENGKFLLRKVTKLYHAFPMQFGMYLTIGIVYFSKCYIKMLLKVDTVSTVTYCAALYCASPYLFKGYFRPYQTYLKWALITNFLHIFTGKWVYCLIAVCLSSIKPSLKKTPALNLCDALCSTMSYVKSTTMSCFPATVSSWPWIFDLLDLGVHFRLQATPDEDIDLSQDDDDILLHPGRRSGPTEEDIPEDVDLSIVTNSGSEQTPLPLDERMALSDEGLYAVAQGTREDFAYVDSGISGQSSHQYLTSQREYPGLGNTSHYEAEESFNSFTHDGQDFALANEEYSAVAQGTGHNTLSVCADSGVSSSCFPNSTQSGLDHDSGAHSKLCESITLLKEVFTPEEPAESSESDDDH